MLEQRAFGAEVRLVPGTIADAGRALAAWAPAPEWWNVATFKEPFRLEGKKTLGYEIAEQSGWRLPDVILYPTGGGTGLVGMWRAFLELAELGWTTGPLPRLVAVQTRGCAPVVRASSRAPSAPSPGRTRARWRAGCGCPRRSPTGSSCARCARAGGTAVAVSEEEMLDGMLDLAARRGLLRLPRGRRDPRGAAAAAGERRDRAAGRAS